MHATFRVIAVIITVATITSCATIVKGRFQDVEIRSNPSEAQLVITDVRGGDVIWNSPTPAEVILRRSRGYFKRAEYLVEVSLDGHQTYETTITSGLNGWYIAGNFFISSFLGWLIVDPLTGAMYNLRPEEISVGLAREVGVEYTDDALRLTIVLLQDIPESVRPKLEGVHQPS